MSVLSNVAVEFSANSAKYTEGLAGMQKKTKAWSTAVKKDLDNISSGFTMMGKVFATVVSAAALTRVATSFAGVAKEISKLADEAEKVGAAAGQFSLLSYAAEKNGATIDDVKIAYKELQKSVNEANAENKTTIENFNKLGVSVDYLNKLNADDRFLLIADALSKVDDENRRAAIGMGLLGKAYVELQPLIAQGGAGIMGFGKGGTVAGVVRSSEDIKSIDAITKKWEEVGYVIKGKLLDALVAMTPLLSAIADLAVIITNNFGRIAVVMGAVFSMNILNSFAKGLEKIFKIPYFDEFAKSAGGAFKGLLQNVEDWFITLAEKGTGVWGKLATTVGVVGAKMINFLRVGLLPVLGTISIVVAGGMAAFGAGIKIMQNSLESLAKVAKVMPSFLFGGEDNKQKLVAAVTEAAKIYEDYYSDIETRAGKAIVAITGFGEVSGAVADEDIAKQKEYYAKMNKMRADAKAAADAARIDSYRKNDPYALLNFTGQTSGETSLIDGFAQSSDVTIKLNYNLKNTSDVIDSLADDFKTAGEQALKFALGAQAASAAQNPFTTQASKIKEEAAAQKAINDAIEEYGRMKSSVAGMVERSMSPMEVYKRQEADINTAFSKKLIDQTTQVKLLKLAMEDLVVTSNVFIGAVGNFGQNMADGFTDALLGAKSFGEAMHDIMYSLSRDILNVIMKQYVLKSLFNSVGGSLFGIADMGQLMYGGPRANGGPVQAGTAYTVGEVGPETFVPQTNGYILPNGVGQGGGVTVVQNINVQSGVNRAEVMSLFPRLKAETLNAVIEARARGGAMSRGITA